MTWYAWSRRQPEHVTDGVRVFTVNLCWLSIGHGDRRNVYGSTFCINKLSADWQLHANTIQFTVSDDQIIVRVELDAKLLTCCNWDWR
jgi:hypothetical protein